MGIYVNQVGYASKGEKRAVVNFPCATFQVVDEAGIVRFEGKATAFGFDKSAGEEVWVADFTKLQEPGRYQVICEGGVEASSPWFEVGDGTYDPLLKDLMKAYYYLRCGLELTKEYAGVYVHKACHVGKVLPWEEAFPARNGEEARPCRRDCGKGDGEQGSFACGGWHDAGDYGRYITAGACALAHLLYAYRMFPEAFDGRTWRIPESGNGVPDLLNECRYELEWFLKMQREDGGVWHKLTTAQHAPFVMPEQDLAQLYFLPVSSMATADHAAICALAAGIYRKYDAMFADRLESASKKSYAWLRANPEFLGFRNPEGCGTGEYGEWSDDSNRFWAAAELYALTGEAQYHQDLLHALEKQKDRPFPLAALGYGEVGGFGALAYLLCDRETKEDVKNQFIEAFCKEAAIRVRTAQECGYGVAMAEWEYGWGSNMGVMTRGMLFAIADFFGLEDRVREEAKTAELPRRWRWPGAPKEEPYVQGPRVDWGWCLRDYAAAQLDYLLGCNALGVSYVTGNGERAYRYPHLRPAHADGIEACMPGMVSGGPNAHPADAPGKALIPRGTQPQKSYLDNYECYSLNEITIYWNSPAVFTVAYLLAQEGK